MSLPSNSHGSILGISILFVLILTFSIWHWQSFMHSQFIFIFSCSFFVISRLNCSPWQSSCRQLSHFRLKKNHYFLYHFYFLLLILLIFYLSNSFVYVNLGFLVYFCHTYFGDLFSSFHLCYLSISPLYYRFSPEMVSCS